MKVLGTTEINGKQYAIVDPGVPVYANGMFAKFILVPTSEVQKSIPADQWVTRES